MEEFIIGYCANPFAAPDGSGEKRGL